MKIVTATSRRSVLAALAAAAVSPVRAKAAKKATAFALIGDRYHNSDYIRTALTRTITREMDISVRTSPMRRRC